MSGIDRTPTMTNNTTPSPYVASASNEGSGAAYLAFDKADSQWIANATTGFLKLDFGSAVWAADEYRIDPQSTTRAPRNWTFEGSNDDSNWTTLDTQTGITTWVTGTPKTFTFTNSTKYRYYRLNISANNGDGSNLEIDELNIFAPEDSGGGYISII